MKTKETIVLMIMIALVVIVLIIALAWVYTPTEFTFQVWMNDHTVEAFKIAYNCTQGG